MVCLKIMNSSSLSPKNANMDIVTGMHILKTVHNKL